MNKIIQLIPAVGWRAVYANSEDRNLTWTSDLVAWGLVEEPDGDRHLEAYDTDWQGLVDSIDPKSSLVMIAGPSASQDDQKGALKAFWRIRDEIKKDTRESAVAGK